MEVRFVVDTLGRVDPARIAVEYATHPAFGEAVRAVAPTWRFHPATLAPGCPVNFQLTRSFDFSR